MMYLDPTQANGDIVALARTNPRHFAGMNQTAPAQDGTGAGFGQLLMNALNGVNDQQVSAEQLSVQALLNPDSVDPHDVTIAAAEASMSLSITKAVVDRVINAYKEILNVR
jgi:flagellar hook-basal body complex protein FliE